QVISEAPRQPRQMVAQHAEAEAFGSAGAATSPAPAGSPARAGAGATGAAAREPQAASGSPQPVRAQPRVGRNDPCPCGSGKKYKKCHMPADERVGTGA